MGTSITACGPTQGWSSGGSATVNVYNLHHRKTATWVPQIVEVVGTGNGGTKTAEYWVVPGGGTYSGEGTQAVDESKVKAVPDHPGALRKKARQ